LKRNRKNQNKTLYRFAGLGTTLAAFIGLGVYGGIQLDKYIEWEIPIGTVAGSMAGLGAGFWRVLKGLKKY
jgi:F0F1-type ATP synthase assembly protein I|tara:strand:+ start:156 stop:368 length:213 start_codon:yes stop_codon:yes gene_type:complete